MNEWTDEQKELIKRTAAQGTTNDEFLLFLHYCQKSGLDPLRKQAHCIVKEYYSKAQQRQVRDVQMVTGIDGFRARAETFPDFLGCASAVVWDCDQFAIDWGTQDIQHVAPYPHKVGAKIIGAWCIVRRQGRPQYLHWLTTSELFDGRSPTHQKMPEIMAKKQAEAQALRHEYPEPFSGIYDLAEIPTAEGDALLLEGGHVESKGEPVEGVDTDSASGSEVENTDIQCASDTDSDTGSDSAEQPADADADVVNDKSGTDDVSDADSTDESSDGDSANNGSPESDSATNEQIERFNELMTWALEQSLIGDMVFEQACEWIEGNRKKNEVGVKIGTWKVRRARHEAAKTMKDILIQRVQDEDLARQTEDVFRQHVMTGEKKWGFAEYSESLHRQLDSTDIDFE